MGSRTAATDWARLVRPSLHGLDPYRPGASIGELRARYGFDEVLKLNWNEDLFGPLPGALEAVEAELANVWMYPEQAYANFRAAVAGWVGTSAEQIVPAHGAQSLIGTTAAVFLVPGDTVVVPETTYGLYAQVCAAFGARIHRVPMADLRIDLAPLAAAARATGARLVWICDPNNPTGGLVDADAWAAFLDELPDRCAVVVDEAYADYVSPERRIRRDRDVEDGRPVVALRSFSKLFGLAGLRLGYAVVDESLAAFYDVVQEPFNVNRAALAAGGASLRRPELIDERRAVVAAARELLGRRLGEAGAEPLPSEANFVLARIGVDDLALTDALARQGILIRAGTEFGLPGYVRVTVGPPEQMERAAEALGRELGRLRGAPEAGL
jgi:histidinol-phosphate aminotransferase